MNDFCASTSIDTKYKMSNHSKTQTRADRRETVSTENIVNAEDKGDEEENGTTSETESGRNDKGFVKGSYIDLQNDERIPELVAANPDKLRAAIDNEHWAFQCVATVASCFLVYSISNYAPYLDVDMAQAIVITLVLATFPQLAAPAGVGAFAGMAGQGTIPSYAWLSLLSLLATGLWQVFVHFKVALGFGGRLGMCVFISMNATLLVFAIPSGKVPWSFYGDASQLWSTSLEVEPSCVAVAACVFISIAAGYVRLKAEIPLNPIQTPTTISLLCMLIVEPTGYQYTKEVFGGLAAGAFVAMASEKYLPDVLSFGIAGFIAGLWILLLKPFFLEFSGKTGFTAFCGFCTYLVLARAMLFGGKIVKRSEQ
jgi:hypothetical protein